MRTGFYTFQPESIRIKASPKRENPKETKDLYRLRNFFHVFSGRIQDSPGQGDNLISWYIEYSYQNNFVRKVPLTVQGYQVVPREQIFVSIGDIL